MPTLHELQSAMAAASLDRGLAAGLRDDRPIPLEDRLRVHRNNTLHGLTDPLAATFPVVKMLVGADFFERLAHDFIRALPPRRADLLLYGQELPGFIAGYEAAASVPYLADMARLELALTVAENAADREPLAPSELQRFAPEQLESLKLVTHPSLRFVASEFPLLEIWQAHQGEPHKVDLNKGGAMLLVYRPRLECLIRAVSSGAFAFVMALSAGNDLNGEPGNRKDDGLARMKPHKLVPVIGFNV